MQTLDSKRLLISLVGITFFFAFGVMPSTAQEKIKIGGKITATITESHMIKVGDTEGHGFLISRSEGTNTSTPKSSFMDGALAVNNNFSDLVKGNGPHEGYIVLSIEGGSAIAKWRGKVTTTMSPGNTPMITMEGTFSYTKGTALFENIQGGGTYKGKYISEKTYIVEWEGEYFIKK
ncbi:MAG: hypothetical protein WBH56_15035 [Bacteroidota bacterium]